MAEDLRIKLKVMPDTSEVSTKIRALEQSEKLKIKVDPQFDITNIDKQTKRIYNAIAGGVNKYAADIMGSIKTVIGTMDLYQGAMADVMTMLKTGNITQENYTKSLDKYNSVMTQTLALSRTFSMMNKNMQTAQREDPIYSTLRDQEKNLSALKKAAANNKAVVAEVQKDILNTLSAGDYTQAFDESQLKEAFSNITNAITFAATKSGAEIKNTIEKIKDSDAQAIVDMMKDLYEQYDKDIGADVFENYNGKGAKSDQAADFLRKMYASKFGDKSVFSDISKEYEVGGRLIKDTIQKLYSDIGSNVELVNQTNDEDALKVYAKNISDDFNLIMTVLTSGSKDIGAEFDKVLSNIQTTMYERGGEIARETVGGSAKQIGEVASGIMKGTLKQAQKEVEDDAEKMKDSVISIATEIQSGLKTAISTPAKTETDYDTGFLMYMSTYKSKIEEFSKSIKSMFSGIDTSKLDDSTRQRVESVLNVMQKLDDAMNDIDGNVGKKMNADIYSKFIDNLKNVSIGIDQVISDISDMTSQNFEKVSFGQLTTQDIEAGNKLLTLMNQIIERQTSLTLAKRGTLKVEEEIIATAKNEKTRLDDMVKEAMSSVKQLEAAQQGVQSGTNSAKSDAEELANAMSKMEVSKLKALLTTITNFVNKLTSDNAKLKDVGGTLQQYKDALDGLKTGVDIYKDAISSLTKFFTGEAVVISAVGKTLNDSTVVQDDKSNKGTKKNKAKTTNPVTRAKSYVKDAQAAAEQIIAALDTTDETLGQIVAKLQGVAATGAQLAGSAQTLDKALDQVEDASKDQIETRKKSTGNGKKSTGKTKIAEVDKIPTQQDVNKEVSQAAQKFAVSIEYVLKQVVAVLEDTSALQANVDAITAKSDTVQSDKDTIVNAFNELVTVFDSLNAAADSIQASMAGLLKLQDIADNVNMTDFAKVINDAVQEQLSKITSTTKAATRKAANVTGSQIANQRKTSGSIESMLDGLSENDRSKYQSTYDQLEQDVEAFLNGSEKSAVVWSDIVKRTEKLRTDIKQTCDYNKTMVSDGKYYKESLDATNAYKNFKFNYGTTTPEIDSAYAAHEQANSDVELARVEMQTNTNATTMAKYNAAVNERINTGKALVSVIEAEKNALAGEEMTQQAAAEAQKKAAEAAQQESIAFDQKMANATDTRKKANDVLDKYNSYASSNTAKSEIVAIANSVSDLLEKSRELRGQVIADPSNVAIVEEYDNVIQKLGKSVDTLETKLQKTGYSISDSLQKDLTSQLGDKDRVVGSLQSLLDGFNNNTGIGAGLQGSKDFVTNIQEVISAISNISSERDVEEFLSGKLFTDMRTKATAAGYGLNSLADIITYVRKEFVDASYAAEKFENAQKNIDNATEKRKAANDLLNRYDEFSKNIQPNAEMQDLAKSIEDLLGKARELRGQAMFDPNNVNVAKEYYTVIVQLTTAMNKLESKMDSAKNNADDSLRNQYNNVNSRITEIDKAMNAYKNNLGNARDKGFDDSAFMRLMNGDSSTGYVGIREALKNVIDSGDYTQLTGVFQQFANELSESGTAAKNLAEFMALVSRKINQAKQSAKEFNDEQQARLNENSWGKSMQNTMYTAERYFKNNSAISKNVEAYAKFTDFFNSWKPKIESKEFTKDNANEMSKAWSTLKKEIQDAGLETDTLAVKLKKLFEVNIKSQLANQVINAFQQGLRQVYQNVVDIDSAMTELKKVTDETSGAYSKFLSEAGDRAKAVGSTVSDIVNATADYARLGYSLDDAKTLADVSAVYYNVGDDLDSFTTATDNIVGTMKAFNLEADDAIGLVDKLNEVSNNFAVSSGDLGNILQRSASAMEAAGNTLDQTIALGTAMNSVLQSADTTGTTLKVLALRLRGASTELASMGEETDGVATSTSKLRAQIAALTNVDGSGGFDILTDSGAFKSTYDIIQGIAKVYDRMSDVDQASLLELIAGKNRANGVAALLKQASQAEDVLQTSLNSSGKHNCLYVQKCA